MSLIWTVLHGGALGDLVLTLQLALRLPAVAESGALRVVARANPGDLRAARPGITWCAAEGRGLHWLYGDHDEPPPGVLRELVGGAAVLSVLGGAHTIVHQRLAELRPARLVSVDPRPRPGSSRHITAQWQSQVEAQGILVPKCVHQRPTQRSLGVPEDWRAAGREVLRQRAGAERVVLVHPGSGGRRKCWPVEQFVHLAEALRAGEATGVVFVVGPVEEELWPAADRAALERCAAVLVAPTADELVRLLAGADVFVGNDAGPSHLAALLGTATVAVFVATDARVWRPLGPSVEVAGADADVVLQSVRRMLRARWSGDNVSR